MATFFKLLLGYMWDCFRSHERLKAEILILRHQLNILHRKAPKRLWLSGGDRALFVWLYRRFPDIGNAAAIVRPETIIRWHRMGFRAWWRWKSHNPGGRPGIDQEPRDLVRRMCKENPLWGAPRIHGELLKLGFDVAQSTVSKYMLRRRGPPSQGWKTFLRNHADGIASVDFLIVPTLAFERLFVFVILGLGRRRLLWDWRRDQSDSVNDRGLIQSRSLQRQVQCGDDILGLHRCTQLPGGDVAREVVEHR